MEVARYRTVSSSDDDSEDDSETCWKRQATEGPNGAPRGPSRKVNNIWGSVLQEQLLTETLEHCSVEKAWVDGDRACESYDFRRKALDPRESPPSSPKGCKRPVHERLGRRGKTEEENKKPMSKEAVVAQQIADRLKEPKKDLLERVVHILGEEKAQQLLNMAEDVESAGGLMTYDKSRRRTPGGVFFHLLKNDRSVRPRQRRAIFANEPRERPKPSPKLPPPSEQTEDVTSPSPPRGGDTPVVTKVAGEPLEEGEITD